MTSTESNTSSKYKAHNDHNVYILGAGFSAQAGLPLITDFMNRMRDARRRAGSVVIPIQTLA